MPQVCVAPLAQRGVSPLRQDRLLTTNPASGGSRLGDIREAVAKLLGAQVRVFVTKCVQAELHALGTDFSGGCLIAKAAATSRLVC
jgi:hypothetical protein